MKYLPKGLEISGRLGAILILWVMVFFQVWLVPYFIMFGEGYNAATGMPAWGNGWGTWWVIAHGVLGLSLAAILTFIVLKRELYSTCAVACVLWLAVFFFGVRILDIAEVDLSVFSGETIFTDASVTLTFFSIATIVVWGGVTYTLLKRRPLARGIAMWTLWGLSYLLAVHLLRVLIKSYFIERGYSYSRAMLGFEPMPILLDVWIILPGPTLTLLVAGILTYFLVKRWGWPVHRTALLGAIAYLWVLLAGIAGTFVVLFPDPFAECSYEPHRCCQSHSPAFLAGFAFLTLLAGVTFTRTLVKRWLRLKSSEQLAFSWRKPPARSS